MDLYFLIRPMGILALIFMFISIMGGLFIRKLKLKLIYHKIGAILTLLAGIIHYILILIYN